MTTHIGTAGWAIPRAHNGRFAGEGSRLERYARVFPVVEINSSFRQEHRASTYARWATTAPAGFRFSVKVPKSITHDQRLEAAEKPLSSFLTAALELGPKLGPLLIQLPPSLEFQRDRVTSFFAELRHRHEGAVVCEPRHRSWFDEEAEEALHHWRVSRVAADPAVVPPAGTPGGWSEPIYYRLHGSPRRYFSSYEEDSIARLASVLQGHEGDVWCIFDNTAHGAATGDGLRLLDATHRLSAFPGREPHGPPAAVRPNP